MGPRGVERQGVVLPVVTGGKVKELTETDPESGPYLGEFVGWSGGDSQ